jgi:Holliday junction DNA helicase RuvA
LIEETFDVLRSLGHGESEARRLLDEAVKSNRKFKDVQELLQAVYESSHNRKR